MRAKRGFAAASLTAIGELFDKGLGRLAKRI